MIVDQRQTLFGIFVLGAIVVSWYFLVTFFESSESKLARYAAAVVAACKDAPYTPACYDEEIPLLMDRRGLSLEEAFHVTALVQEEDPEYWYCHVLGHNISAKEAAKDLSKWTDVVARCPVGQCSNGCLHGAFQERFRDNELTPEEYNALIPKLTQICRDSPGRDFTGLEQSSCYHALGHLAMYITKANHRTSTALCDEVIIGDDAPYRRSCYDGAFMQIYQPLEPEDEALVKDIAPKTPAQAEELCGSYEGVKKHSCHRESWPLYLEQIKTPSGIAAFCDSGESPKEIQVCYNAIVYILVPHFQLDESRIIPLCDSLKDPYRGQCFANAASRVIEIDKKLIPEAMAYCAAAEDRGLGERCYREMLYYSIFAFNRESEAFTLLCSSLPEPWRAQCFNGDGSSIQLHAVE